ncbi:conserved hypothetical protein [Rubrivivax sp. A210]|nr:conserved hypothetical protein [Rubrivivax sp. A210]
MKPDHQPPVARRALLVGAGTAGALVATATLVPLREPAKAVPSAAAQPAPDAAAGYRLSEHVQQYYRTARV